MVNLKTFQTMDSEYFKDLLNLKEQRKETYQVLAQRIAAAFEEVKSTHNNNACFKLEYELQTLKDFRQLKPSHRQPLYKYFVQRNCSDLGFMRDNRTVELRLIKATKTHLDDYRLDWRQVWQNVLLHEPEVPAVKLYSELMEFLKNVRHLYDPDNALQVVDYFLSRHSLHSSNLYIYISLFANLTARTAPPVVEAYLQRLLTMYELNQLKANNLLVMLINAAKFHSGDLPYSQLNRIILYSLLTPADKKDSIEPKFNTQTANIILKVIGSRNPHSLQLLQHVFQVIKNFIRPFEDTKKPFKFFYHLLSSLAKRLHTEDAWRKKITALREKQEKKKRKQQRQKQQQQQQEEKQKEEEEKQKEKEDNEESAVTCGDKPEGEKAEGEKGEGEKGEEEKEDSGEESEEEEDKDESQEEQQDGSIEKMVAMEMDMEENVSERLNSIESKIEKLEAYLKNSISEDIQLCFKKFISEKFQDIFYVNSKKIVPKVLKNMFDLYPEFICKSFQVLEKAANIPQINEEALISNVTHIAKYLFSKPAIGQGLLDNVLRLLNRVKDNRRIAEVWDIITCFTQKIPLLDEKDAEKVDQKEKEAFASAFGHPHDQFYESYSDLVFDCMKRLFEESHHFDAPTTASIDKSLIDILANAYPHFKKRVLSEMEQRIAESANQFLLLVFHSSLKASPSLQATLRELTENRNIESEERLEVDINVNIILSGSMEIGQIKQLIRKYSRKNNYRFLSNTMINLTNYNLHLPPLPTTLAYLHTKPTFTITQDPPYSFIHQKLELVYQYTREVLQELAQELSQFSALPLQGQDYHQLISKMYDSAENNFKNLKVEKRKTVNELLEILRIIQEHLFHEMEEYDPATNSIQYRQPPYDRQSLLHDALFKQVLDALVYNEIFLHDPNIMHNLSSLLENEVLFMYRHQLRLEKDILKKYSRKNQKEELPGESNLIYITNLHITKARIAHFCALHAAHAHTVDIAPFHPQLALLLIAPGNDKSNTINKILVKKSTDLKQHAHQLIDLLSNHVQSRFYIEKVLSLIADFSTIGYDYSTPQVLSLIDLHIPLIQSQNLKIRDASLKSFEKLSKSLSKGQLMGEGEGELRKYLDKEKAEIVWMIAVILILREPKRNTPTHIYLQHIQEYLRHLATLIQSETRIIRRISLFTYSLCLRKAKKAITTTEEVTIAEKYSRPKTIEEIYASGYLRDEHIGHKSICNLNMLKKMSAYSTYEVKKKADEEIYKEIEAQAFQFMLKDPQVGEKILRQFHIDMAASVQQVLSMMQNKKHDLGEIALRLLESCYVYTKMKKLHFDRIENYFGERFYRYLFLKDASKGFPFFLHSRTLIYELLPNFEAFDNQTLIFTLTLDVFLAYQKHRVGLSEEVREQVEKFILKIISEVIYKGSSVLFKKLSVMLSNNSDKQATGFVVEYLQALLRRGEKVGRVSQLLFILQEDDYSQMVSVVSSVLEQQQEINHNFVHLLINSIITLPEKYLLTQTAIDRYAFIDPQTELQKGSLQLYKPHIFMLSTHRFNELLLAKLNHYLQQAADSQLTPNSRHELIKATYTIATHSLSAYIQFYQTDQTILTAETLLQTLLGLFDSKMELQVDFKQLEEALKQLFSTKYEQIDHFHRLLHVLARALPTLPPKKQADLLALLAHRPANFLFAHRPAYTHFLLAVLRLEDNSVIYRDLLLALSTLLACVPLSADELTALADPLPAGQGLLLLQAHLLSTLEVGSRLVERVVRESGKERRKVFCKEMMLGRGKKEYLDGEEEAAQWKQLKQHSNPYHYHA